MITNFFTHLKLSVFKPRTINDCITTTPASLTYNGKASSPCGFYVTTELKEILGNTAHSRPKIKKHVFFLYRPKVGRVINIPISSFIYLKRKLLKNSTFFTDFTINIDTLHCFYMRHSIGSGEFVFLNSNLTLLVCRL